MKVVLITGAANGIGLALSIVCLQKGMIVVMADKDQHKLTYEAQQLAKQFPQQIFNCICDVTKIESVKNLAEFIQTKLERIDWIFNNAGIIGTLAPAWELEYQQVQQVIDVNIHGMLLIIKTFFPILFKQDFRAHLINMASLYGLCSGSHVASYTMSKHAVLALSESLYFDLKRMEKPIDISVVCPSFTDTALLSTTNDGSAFHNSLNSLLAHSRPAFEMAENIVQQVEQKKFYILPDEEVRTYAKQRVQAILEQENPHVNEVEQLMSSLLRRKLRHTGP